MKDLWTVFRPYLTLLVRYEFFLTCLPNLGSKQLIERTTTNIEVDVEADEFNSTNVEADDARS